MGGNPEAMRQSLFHRLAEVDQAILDDYVTDRRISFIEWPEVALPSLDGITARVNIEHAGGDRAIMRGRRAEQVAVGAASHQHHAFDGEGEARHMQLRHIGDQPCPLAQCDRAGEERGVSWVGASAIIDPDGGLLARGQGMLTASVDLARARDKRWNERNDALADRRPELSLA